MNVAGIGPMPAGKVALLGVLTIVSYGTWFYGFGVLIEDMAADLGTGIATLTAGYALAQVLTGVLGVVTGRLLDHRGATAPFALGAAIGPALMIASTFASEPWLFAVLFGVGGGVVGASAFYQMTQAVVARLSPGGEARAIARLTIWGAFASPVLIPLTEVLRRSVGWQNTVRIGAIAVGLVLAVAALTIDRAGTTASQRPSPKPLTAVRQALADHDVRRLALSSLSGAFGASTLLVLQVPAMVAGGIERSTAAGLAGARGLAQLLGRLPLGFVLRRVTTRRALVGAKVTIGVGALLLAATTHIATAVVFVVVAGIGIGAVSPLEGIYAREVLPEQDFGTLMGSLHLLLGVSAGLGPLLAALVVDLTGVTWSGLVLAAAASFGGAALLSTKAGTERPAVTASQ